MRSWERQKAKFPSITAPVTLADQDRRPCSAWLGQSGVWLCTHCQHNCLSNCCQGPTLLVSLSLLLSPAFAKAFATNSSLALSPHLSQQLRHLPLLTPYSFCSKLFHFYVPVPGYFLVDLQTCSGTPALRFFFTAAQCSRARVAEVGAFIVCSYSSLALGRAALGAESHTSPSHHPSTLTAPPSAPMMCTCL
jgi:hypothetical protein